MERGSLDLPVIPLRKQGRRCRRPASESPSLLPATQIRSWPCWTLVRPARKSLVGISDVRWWHSYNISPASNKEGEMLLRLQHCARRTERSASPLGSPTITAVRRSSSFTCTPANVTTCELVLQRRGTSLLLKSCSTAPQNVLTIK